MATHQGGVYCGFNVRVRRGSLYACEVFAVAVRVGAARPLKPEDQLASSRYCGRGATVKAFNEALVMIDRLHTRGSGKVVDL